MYRYVPTATARCDARAMATPVGWPPTPRPRHASFCVDWYATKLQERLLNATWLIDAALDRLSPQCIFRRQARQAAGHASGGLAVLLRGGAFRGSEKPDVNRAAQIECARSVERMIVRPFADRGDRVGVFLTVYDADVNPSKISIQSLLSNPSLLQDLQRPFGEHLELVTVLAASASEQILGAYVAVKALQEHCRLTGAAYETVLITRFDMRFKQSFGPLLGDAHSGRLRPLHGIRFLWHELGHGWRVGWSPTAEQLEKAKALQKQGGPWEKAKAEQQLAEWERLSKAMDRTRKATARSFNGSRWRQDARVGDTLHAFAFAFAGCFMGALRFELQRDWPRPRLAPGPHAATLAAAMSKHLQEAGDASAVLSLGTDDESTHRLRRALAALGPVEKGLVRAFPQTHWLHKMGYHLHIALGVDLTSREWRENRTALPQLGYLAEGTRIMIANDCHRVALLTIADCAPRQAPSARTRAARTVT